MNLNPGARLVKVEIKTSTGTCHDGMIEVLFMQGDQVPSPPYARNPRR
jgi:hypothetical protein